MILTERARVLSELEHLLQGARNGEGSVAVITGPVAVGKTELAHSLARTAEKESELLVLRAQALMTGKSKSTGVFEQLADGIRSANDLPSGGSPEAPWSADVRGATQIAEEIARCSRRTPVLVVVDDLHRSDPESLDGILHLVRLARTSRIMVVLVVTEGSHLVIPLFHAELLRAPHCRRVRLSPLSAAGVAEVVERVLGAEAARLTADDYYRYSGGNPLVLRALLEEWCSTSRRGEAEQVASDAVAELRAGQVSALAVFTSVHRSGPDVMAVARGIAVLGVTASVELLALVLKADVDRVAWHVKSLEEAGVLNGLRFRHPRAAEAVLADPEFGRLRALRHEAAAVLEAEGYSRSLVAGHLVAAGSVTEPWTTSVLRESAAEAIGKDDWSFAFKCLDLALRGPLDDEGKGLIITELLRVVWRLNPARVIKYFPECFELQQKGHILDREIASLLKIFLWHGHMDEAAEMLLDVANRTTDTTTRQELHYFLESVRISHPALYERIRAVDEPVIGKLAGSAGSALLCPLAVLRGALSEEGSGNVATMAESILAERRPGGESVTAALQALLYSEELALAERWVTRVMEDVDGPNPNGSRGIHHAIRAETVRRRGDLMAAEQFAESALKRMAPRAWGVALGLPLGSLVASHVARGNVEQAEEYLSWIVPRGMFQTFYGLGYLDARGRYRLTVGQYAEAQQDFLRCGDLMKSWGMDVPSLAAWRLGAAEAAMALGDRGEARRLIEGQLRRPRAQSPRIRGAALRVYAVLVDRHRRLPVLTEAAELLSDGRDFNQHFLALADLSRAYQDTGDSHGARAKGQQAWQAAVRCGAERLARTLLPDCARVAYLEPAVLPSKQRLETAQLSEAERRVAELAAVGETNREISGRLFITISTVEQHLTRVYRKLRVSGRADLRACLAGDAVFGDRLAGSDGKVNGHGVASR